MLTISRDKVYDRLDKNIPPSAICESGETVIFETRDCYDDSVTSEERPLGDREDALGNPATGPLYINGADADVAGFAYVGMPNRKSADDGARGIPQEYIGTVWMEGGIRKP